MSQSTNTVLPRTAHRPATGRLQGFGKAVVTAADIVSLWLERRRQRRALEALSDHMLSDIGISRADVEHEAEKPFWRG